ncbi:MAG: YibE/F family protein [Spirochaetes bacterium]|nr:YibE/F family protein [Spirochaetota bacterium]
MFSQIKKTNHRDIAFVIIVTIITTILFFLPTGFEKKTEAQPTLRVKGKILETDDSELEQFGIVRTGVQGLKIKILSSRFKGEVVTATNSLMGKMNMDVVFAPGDVVLVGLTLSKDAQKIHIAHASDYYRTNLEFALFLIFAFFLLIYGGFTGFRAVVSFVFSIFIIWKILLPYTLKGKDPILLTLGITMALTFTIIFLVGGINNKGFVAFLGGAAGIVVTCVLSLFFGKLFRIHGAVKPFAETLLYSGFGHLDLSKIFLSSIFISASGAVMDLAMDISAAMYEVVDKHPHITLKKAILSGLSVGRAVVGTMTTTLLLAYTGSYTTMLMMFMAQGTPVINILNFNMISAEILHTIVGSFGLVTVAPFTAIIGGFIFTANKSHHTHT